MHKHLCVCVYIYIYKERERERDTYVFSFNIGRYKICMFKIHILLLFHLNITFPTDINLYTQLLFTHCMQGTCVYGL